jgi:gamma-glutamylcyclotransferase (GGCT)/AIG2-like uncharacterized protein YtfP
MPVSPPPPGSGGPEPPPDLLGEPLFAYGTLLSTTVLREIVGRIVTGPSATLLDYRRFRISGADYPAIVPHPGGQVDGRLYRGLSVAERSRIAEYEGELYVSCRLPVVVAGRSIEASTYVLRDEHRPLLREGDWSLDEYERARRANPPP